MSTVLGCIANLALSYEKYFRELPFLDIESSIFYSLIIIVLDTFIWFQILLFL